MNLAHPHLVGLVAGLALAAGLIASTMLVTNAWLRISESQNITVTGSVRKPVRSDLAIWRGSFSVESQTLLQAQKALKEDLAKVHNFLAGRGVTNLMTSPISIQELRARQKAEDGSYHEKMTGFRLSQTVEARSPDVEGLTRLNHDSTVLVEQGVLFTPMALEYIYTKAGDVKAELLAEATKDARSRAEQIALQGGRHVDHLRAAKMGVFQITPLHSTHTSWEGLNDTSSLEKTVTAIVTATFAMR
ncbi:MAG: SIMPL domain-containing protein [Verrucomicrobia bacterium]|nr:SIMPL domain-containing protein [Verrucomicrobiota bacterium]